MLKSRRDLFCGLQVTRYTGRGKRAQRWAARWLSSSSILLIFYNKNNKEKEEEQKQGVSGKTTDLRVTLL